MTKRELNKMYVKLGYYTTKKLNEDDYDKNNDFMCHDYINGTYYEIVRPDFTVDELNDLIELDKVMYLKSINSILVFFKELTIIGICVSLIYLIIIFAGGL